MKTKDNPLERIKTYGIVGIIFGSCPFLLLTLPGFTSIDILSLVLLNLVWLIAIGIPMTSLWSNALHDMVTLLNVN